VKTADCLGVEPYRRQRDEDFVIRPVLQSLCLAASALTLVGCGAFGAVAYKLSPQPATPAEFKPENQTTLVLVENYSNPDLFEVESERLERDVAYLFAEHKVFPVVPVQKLRDFKSSSGSTFYKMDIPKLAKALGAKQVIYVELEQFSNDPPLGGQAIRGKASAMVKLIDGESGQVLWPRDSSAGRQVKYQTALLNDSDDHASIEERLYQHLSDQIARLFYESPADQVDGAEPALTGT